MLLPMVELNYLLKKKDAQIKSIVNVNFFAEQIWFSINAFDLLNETAEFRPYQEAHR
jgi:hypothetical protein